MFLGGVVHVDDFFLSLFFQLLIFRRIVKGIERKEKEKRGREVEERTYKDKEILGGGGKGRPLKFSTLLQNKKTR